MLARYKNQPGTSERRYHDFKGPLAVVPREMDAQGAYPEVLWDHADAVVRGGTDILAGVAVPLEDSYGPALGCNQR